MDLKTNLLSPEFELCEAKAAKVMRWISESEDISKTEFAVARLFELGVFEDNTKAFLHLLLESQFPGDRIGLELPPEQLHALISEAFTNTYLYLLTPLSFISGFLSFGMDTVKINNEMLSRLSYFIDYPYFPELIDEWLAVQLQRGRDEIPLSEFRDLLLQLDRSIIMNSSLEKLGNYLKPLYQFHNEAKTLSAEVIAIFLKDKHLSMPDRLKRSDYEIEDTAYLLKEAIQDVPIQESKRDFAPIPEYDTFLKELRDIGIILPPPMRINRQEGTVALLPVQMLISKKLRNKCIEKIFRGNLQEYERMIVMLNSSEEYSQAQLNLKTLLGIHKISSESKTALRLEEVLCRRFNIPTPVYTTT
jgi:hypothetical protein